jgi:3-hydroxyisobutyrate dehydrogenase-like beta-hydroxyacid dehydrogenase
MAVAVGQNVDLKRMLDIMSVGAANSGTLQRLKPALLDGRMDTHQFALGDARKDVRYFRALADNNDLSTPVSDAIHQVYTHAVNLGFGNELIAALFKYQELVSDVVMLKSESHERKAS